MRLMFLLAVTPVIWLVVVAPLTVLFSWWTEISTGAALLWSVLAAPLVSLWFFVSVQSSSLLLKWPVTQLIGLTTILMNIVVVCSVLLFLFPSGKVALIATGVWIAVSCFAIWTAHNIRNTRVSITSKKLKHAHRIMHLSDIHAGSRSSAFIDKVVTQTIEHNPDAVFITGDLLDSSEVDKKYLQPLGKFNCPVYLCLGNHERYVNLQNAIDAIKANNVHVLRNETTTFRDIEIIGIDDADNADQVANELPLIKRSTDKFQILLYHRPQGFEVAADNGIDLMLSGHTHAGQVWPFGILVKRQFPLIKGQHQHNSATLYVSQGTGTWGPIMRLGTISEMTLIELGPEIT